MYPSTAITTTSTFKINDETLNKCIPIDLNSSLNWVFAPNHGQIVLKSLPFKTFLTRMKGGNFFQNFSQF